MKSEKIAFTLSFDNLRDIPIEKYEKNFTFIVNGKRYSTTRFVADLLSPKIRKLHFIDGSIQDFYIDTDEPEQEKSKHDDYFSEFLNLCNFDEYHFDDIHRTNYSTYFLKLGNIDEYFKLQGTRIDTDDAKEMIDILLIIYKNRCENSDEINFESEHINKIISTISKHFYDLSTDELKKLPNEILYEIISSEHLVVRDEDSLFEIVMKLYESDYSYSTLFSEIIFNNLSTDSIEKFIEIFSIEHLNEDIWRSFCSRLLPKEKEKERLSTERRYSCREFNIEKGHEFEGIMNYLIKETNGNIHDNGTIEITSNSINNDKNHPKNLVDYQKTNYYQSDDEPNAFVCFDFKDRKIQLSSYSIGSGSNGPNSSHLRNWVVEVSNDGKKYEEVDRHSEDSTLNGSKITGTFKISSKQKKFYRFIRLRSTGYSWRDYPNSDNYRIYFYFIEFFGKLEDK